MTDAYTWNNLTLLPCPFCSCEPKMKVDRKGNAYHCYVQCRRCNSRSGVMLANPGECRADVEADAINAWNKRADKEVEHG